MKKILITIFTVTLFAVNTFAQTNMKQGHITYTITVTGNPQAEQMMSGSTMSYTIKDSMIRVDMDMTMMQTKAIMDGKTKTGTILMDMMGNKYAVSLTPKDLKEEEGKMPDYDVKYVDSTKVIVGHICKKAVVTIKDKGGDRTFTVWYDPTMKMPVDNKNTYNKINGLPLEYTMETAAGGQYIDMKFLCTAIDSNPVDASAFAIPDGYTPMTMDQLKSMGGGH